MNLLQYILLTGLFILPHFYWEVPKVWSYVLFIYVFILSVLYLFLKSKIILKFKPNKIVFSFFCFFAIASTASYFGVDFNRSLVGNYYRLDGLMIFLHLMGFAIIISEVYSEKWNRLVAISIFLSATFCSIWNHFGQINFLVGFILTSMPFGIYVYLGSKSNFLVKLIIAISYALQIYTIMVAKSYVGAIGILTLPLLTYLFFKRKNIFLLTTGSILILFFIVSAWLFNLKNEKHFVAESRVRIYHNIFLGSLSSPLIGVGWSNTDHVFKSIDWPIKFQNDVYVDKAHMQLLDIFSNTGIIGLVFYLYFLYLVVIKLYKSNSNWSNVLILSLIMHFLYVQTNITSISEEFIFWIIVGIAVYI